MSGEFLDLLEQTTSGCASGTEKVRRPALDVGDGEAGSSRRWPRLSVLSDCHSGLRCLWLTLALRDHVFAMLTNLLVLHSTAAPALLLLALTIRE